MSSEINAVVHNVVFKGLFLLDVSAGGLIMASPSCTFSALLHNMTACGLCCDYPRGAPPIMDYTGRLPPQGVPFSGWSYIIR